jgi:hypothetical protein
MNWLPSEKLKKSLQKSADACGKPVYVHLLEDGEILICNSALPSLPHGFSRMQLAVFYPNKKGFA